MKPKYTKYLNGDQTWHLNCLLHRLDGPAVICKDGYQAWYINDQLHRTDGPAIIDQKEGQEWYVNGKLHRIDGPAVIGMDSKHEYYINGRSITKKVLTWLRKQDVAWPWNEEIQAQFALTFS
jgi:hypothetical protein